MADPITCPHCGAELCHTVTTQLRAQSRITLRLEPHKPGSLLLAGMIGDAITSVTGSLKRMAAEHGVVAETFIERIVAEDDGAMSITFLVSRSTAPTEIVGET